MNIDDLQKKGNLHYIRVVTKRVLMASDGTRLRGLAPGQDSFEETSQPWRADGDPVPDFTDLGFETQTYRTDNNVLASEITSRSIDEVVIVKST